MRIFYRPSAIVALVILVVIPTVIYLASPGDWQEWWILRFHAPALERDLGFVAAVEQHPVLKSRTLFIKSIQPGGVFDQSGVKTGWVPKTYHRRILEFYGTLQANRGKTVELAFAEIHVGVQNTVVVVNRRVQIAVPPERPN